VNDIYETAAYIDEAIERAHALRLMAREARRHGNRARVVRDHVLVIAPCGAARAFRNATSLVAWMGY
jgi:hypothetical protein